MVRKIYSEMHPLLCTNTGHDVTDFVYHGMVKNTKTRISQEPNRTFLWNKNFLRNYRFIAEVTFKYRDCRWDLENLESKVPLGTSRIQLVCMKVQARSSSEAPLEYNLVGCGLFNQFGSYRNMQFQISSRGGIADLPLLRKLLAIPKKSRELS